MRITGRRMATATAMGGALAVGLGGAAGTSPAGAQAGCTPQFTSSPTSFVSSLCGMPDLDQRRTAAVLQGDGRVIDMTRIGGGQIQLPLALPGNGGCHCVPTSFTNLLAYYAGKGVVGNFPRAFAWDGRQGYLPRPDVAPETYLAGQPYPADEVAAYKAATFAIRILGQDVKTGSAGCGTTFQSVLGYFAKYRTLFPKITFATTVTKPGAQAPKQIANILAAGGTVNVAHGPYNSYMETPGGGSFNEASWGSRAGGHVVTVRGVSGSGPAGKNATLVISDPATNVDPAEGGDKDRFRQSVTSPQTIPLTRVYDSARKLYRWRFGDIGEPAGTMTRLLDEVLTVYPVLAVMTNGGTIKLLPGLEFNNGSTPPSELRARTFSVGSRTQPVLDAAFLPSTGEIAYIRKGDDKVRAIGAGTRETRVVGDAPAAAAQIETDPTGARIFVGGRNEIAELAPHADDAAPKVVKVPSPVRALAFDPTGGVGGGRLVAITGDRGLTRYQPGTLARVGAGRRLPAAAFEGTGAVSATVDSKGQVYVRRGASTQVARVTTTKSSRGSVSTLKGAGGYVIGERGTAFSIVDGKVVEISPAGKAVPGSVFTGRSGGGRLVQVTRSGVDGDPALADTTIDSPRTDPDFPEIG